MNTIPTSLYVHLPWCEKKCPYCDFNSHARPSVIPESEYVQRLLDDFQLEMKNRTHPVLHSVFIGGGTPSLFSPQSLGRLIAGLEPYLMPQAEITLEANPGSSEYQKFAAYREIGINRLSVGIQSFQDEFLQRLGRIHSGQNARDALNAVLKAGFTRWNLDLMFGLPGQTVETALKDLEIAASFQPSHLSWYQLTIEPQTAFYQIPPKDLPSHDALSQIQEQGLIRLQENGLKRYEISAFAATPSEQSQHNLNYWQFGDYIGIGAGAHGKKTILENGRLRVYRTMKQKSPLRYLNPDWPLLSQEEWPTAEQIALEFFMNVLRLTRGVPSAFWATRTGLTPATLIALTEPLQQAGFFEKTVEMIQCTPQGLLFLNEILLRLSGAISELSED